MPPRHGLPVEASLQDRGPEDGGRAVIIATDQPRHLHLQHAGVPGDGHVRRSAFDAVNDPAEPPAGQACGGKPVQVTVDGDGGVSNRPTEENVTVRLGTDPAFDEVLIRRLHLVAAGSFYVPGP